MTAIASWVNKEMKTTSSIWTIGDTKVIGSEATLSLESSKVLELQIRCRDMQEFPDVSRYYFHHSIGYAYAGSSLTGLNVFATMQSILHNLCGSKVDIPSLEAIAETATKVTDYYAKSICYRENNFEGLIYGFCFKSMSLKRFYIQKMGVDFKYTSVPEEEIVQLGDKKKEILQEIIARQDAIMDKSSLKYWRTPMEVLSDITISGKYDTIGGGTQLNIATPHGCDPYYAAREKKSNESRFRNINLFEDIGTRIGDCFIGISGMDYKIADDQY